MVHARREIRQLVPRLDLRSNNRNGARRLAIRLGVTVSAVMAMVGMSVAPASAAQAAPHPCWSATYDTEISKFNVAQVVYFAKFTWCATNGKVDYFVVDKAYANASGWARDADIDLQPFKPEAFGQDTFDVYLNAWGNKKADPIVLGHEGSSVTLATGDYRDFYDISLYGDGVIKGTKHKFR